MRRLAAMLIGLGVVLAACGGGGSSSSSSTKSFCSKAKQLNSDKSLSNLGQSQDPKQQQADLDKAAKAVADLKTKAPAEIKTDMAKISDDINQANAEFQRVNGDFTKVDPAKFQAVQSQEFSDASDRVDKFAQAKCGIKLNG